MSARLAGATGLIAVAALFRGPLEASPLTHVLVQLPVLALAGALTVPHLRFGRGDWNRGGWACLLAAGFGIAFWMLPRSIDAALTNIRWEAAKFLTLPFLVGLPLAAGYARAHDVLEVDLIPRTRALQLLEGEDNIVRCDGMPVVKGRLGPDRKRRRAVVGRV